MSFSIALYVRVSSPDPGEHTTVDSQLAELKERVVADGHRLLPDQVYVDDGYSGTTLLRPALERLRDHVAEGRIDRLYVLDPDRLARRYAYQVLLLEEFSAHGVAVVFLKGPTSENAEDTLLIQVQGMIAEYERAKILERHRRGRLYRARQGSINVLVQAPYGYRYLCKTNHEPARFEVVLHEAKVVRQIFHAFVDEQASLSTIARKLNETKVPTRRHAKYWRRGAVWELLHNPAYMGLAAYGKTERVERQPPLRLVRGRSAMPRCTKSIRRIEEPERWISIPVPALISADLFEAARLQLERNRRLAQQRGRRHRYLLQGLTVCARCGYAFIGQPASSYAYYRCVGTDPQRFGEGRICHVSPVRVDRLDGYVWESVCQTLRDPQRVLDEWSQRVKVEETQTALHAQRDEAARVLVHHERSLTRLLDAYEAGSLELTELTGRVERIKGRIQHARREVQDAEARRAQAFTLHAVVDRLEDFAAQIERGLEHLDWDTRKKLIRTLVARVEIDEEGATVVYRLPPSRSTPEPDNAPPDASKPGAAQIYRQRLGRRSTSAVYVSSA